MISGDFNRVEKRIDSEKIKSVLLKKEPEILKKNAGVNIRSTEFEGNSINSATLDGLLCAKKHIIFMPLDINLHEID